MFIKRMPLFKVCWLFFFLKDYPTCDQLTCANGACYNTSQRCDQKVDCRDSSDEANCSKSYPLTRRWQVEAGLYRFERNQCIHTLLPKPVPTESLLVVWNQPPTGCISTLLPNKSLLKYEVGSSNEIRWWQLNWNDLIFFLVPTSCPSYPVFAKRIWMWQWRVYPSRLRLWPWQWLWR